MLKGNYAHDVRAIHEKYGDAVRLAPNEVSFAAPEAWHEIFDQRPDHLTFPKNPLMAEITERQARSGTSYDDKYRESCSNEKADGEFIHV